MILYLWRHLRFMIAAHFKPRVTVLDPVEQKFRALPFPVDCEWNRLNGNKYTAFMDHARMAFSVRVGVSILPLIKKRWIFTIAEQHIAFFRSIRPVTPFVVRTRIVCWGEKYCFCIQEFFQKDILRARGYVKFVVRHPAGVVPMAEVIEATGYSGPSPAIPPELLEVFSKLKKES